MTVGPATPRRTHAQRTAESAARLQLALAELIAEQGYQRTTAAEIGERAGYSRAMVRDRFGSKDALLESLHERYQALLREGDDTPGRAGLDRALSGVDRLHGFATEYPVLLRAIYVVSFEAVGAAHVIQPIIVRWVDELAQNSRTWLTVGIDDGSVRSDLDVAAESERFLLEAIGGGFRWVLDPQGVDYPAFLRSWGATLRARYAA